MAQSIDGKEPIVEGTATVLVVVVLAVALGKLLVRLIADESR